MLDQGCRETNDGNVDAAMPAASPEKHPKKIQQMHSQNKIAHMTAYFDIKHPSRSYIYISLPFPSSYYPTISITIPQEPLHPFTIYNSYVLLVGGLEHEFYFSIQLGISSSQLTNSYFSEGWSTTNQELHNMVLVYNIVLPYYKTVL